MIKEILDRPAEYHKSSGKFSISSIGTCWRKKYLEMKGLYKEEFNEKAKRAFALGDAFHRHVVGELMTKCDATDWKVIAAEVNIPEHPFITGRCDIILGNSITQERVIVDTKSCSDWTFNKAQEGEIADNYRWQVQLYLHFFNLQRGFLLFFSKHKGDYCEVEIIRDDVLIKKLLGDIKHFWDAYVVPNIEPPFCDGYNGGVFQCPVCNGGNGDAIKKL